MPSRRNVIILLLVLIGCVGCDQGTKFGARTFIPKDQTLSLAADTIRMVYAENDGAFLGLGAKLPKTARTLIFSAGVLLILFGFLVFTLRERNAGVIFFLGSGMIIGGGLSNLIDRIWNNGSVIDFLNVGLGPVRTGIFNVADVAILLGAVFLLIHGGGPNNNTLQQTGER